MLNLGISHTRLACYVQHFGRILNNNLPTVKHMLGICIIPEEPVKSKRPKEPDEEADENEMAEHNQLTQDY